MSWDIEAASVLPPEIQEEVALNFSPELLAEKLSDHVVTLETRIQHLEVTLQAYAKYYNKEAMERDIRLLNE